MILVITLSISTAFFATSTLYYHLKIKKLRERSNSIELQEFLRDLVNGHGMIEIRRVNPDGLIRWMRQR